MSADNPMVSYKEDGPCAGETMWHRRFVHHHAVNEDWKNSATTADSVKLYSTHDRAAASAANSIPNPSFTSMDNGLSNPAWTPTSGIGFFY